MAPTLAIKRTLRASKPQEQAALLELREAGAKLSAIERRHRSRFPTHLNARFSSAIAFSG